MGLVHLQANEALRFYLGRHAKHRLQISSRILHRKVKQSVEANGKVVVRLGMRLYQRHVGVNVRSHCLGHVEREGRFPLIG